MWVKLKYVSTHIFRVWLCEQMANVTISVPDQMKAEMDTLSEVNWSEICRKAISQYIAQRKNPTPNIELDLRSTRLYHLSFDTGYPTLQVELKIHNKMESDITVDRIIFSANFARESRYLAVGSGYYLHKKAVDSNSSQTVIISLILHKEVIESLKSEFTSTFNCDIQCVVYVEDFKNPYNQKLTTQIPIDVWKSVVEKVLEKPPKMKSDVSVNQ